MCFVICREQRETKKPYIAGENIEVFKFAIKTKGIFGRIKYLPLIYSGRIYRIGKITKSKLTISDCFYTSKRGIYSFSTTLSEERIELWSNFSNVVLRCYIPKGAKYFMSGDGEYCSNKLKIIEEIKIKDVFYNKYK